MKQRWLTTSNLADDAAATPAFAVQYTSTATSSTGSLWVEYTLEFASPRAPTSPVSLADVTAGSSPTYNTITIGESPNEPQVGKQFWVAVPSTIQGLGNPGALNPEVSTVRKSDWTGLGGSNWANFQVYLFNTAATIASKYIFNFAASGVQGHGVIAQALTRTALSQLTGVNLSSA